MTTHRNPSVFRHKGLAWLTVCLILGVGILLLWPRASLREADIFILVDLGNIPEGLTITGNPSKGLDVRVHGPKTVIEKLPDLKLRYPIDLSNANVGLNTINIETARVSLPGDISIIKIEPSFLTIKIEKEIKKEVPVIVFHSGKPASGFFVSDTIANPSSIILRGPENVLGPIQKVFTKTIDVNGLSESFKKEIAINLAEGLEVISPSRIILVELSVQERVVAKTFADIPVEGRNTPYAFSISPAVIRIEIKGPANVIERLKPDKGIKVYVDLKTLKPGVYVRRAAISLPVETALVSVSPEIFTVKLDPQVKTEKHAE
jgi:YbbR domain-containing protein